MQTSTLFSSDFSKFMVCPHGQREVELVRTFFGQGGKEFQFFANLCGRILWTAPYRMFLYDIDNRPVSSHSSICVAK